ncbi:MAG: SpoIIIAC/SpoIIIAD family protein [Lachnospiraceae bacterium]
MTVVTIAMIGIVTVLLAVQLKHVKGEYGIYLVLAGGFFIFFYGVGKLEVILETMRKIQSYIKINQVYLASLMKMIGITYIAEFASGICKDAGYGAMGTQIEIFAKLSILAVSMPILLALMETLQMFLQ